MSSASKRRAVFLDRDGTIAEEVGYANHISRFDVFPFAAAAIRRLNEARIPVIVVTNQSGVARGFFPESLVVEIHEKMKSQLAAGGAHVEAIYYCPHIREDNCRCRKPLPGMLERAAKEHNLELAGSTLVSDRYDDISLAHSVGGRGILVLSGYGRGEHEWNRSHWPRMPEHVVENLTMAVEILLKGAR
ncbi:MAG TPA: HAD family hydrolase [Candidatus Acidoferrales bacterium]|nr:HAD family hydrolase [Candidatus Acidoferrales bacterium]